MHLRTIEWISDHDAGPVPGRVRFIDQTRLPLDLVYVESVDVREIWQAIKTLQVRGAPAIGVAGAMGVAVAVQAASGTAGELVRVAH